jgi:ankyrin repeat protein
VNNNAELTRLLLDAGAKPDDNESLYHSSEHADLACFRLLLERATPERATKVLNHMLDKDDLEGVRLLLAAGADPNRVNQRGETPLHWAVWRGRSAPIIEALLDGGAAIDMRRQKDGRTPYAIAVQSGQTETANLLASRGADTEVSPLDRFLGECAAAGPEELERLAAARPGGKLPEEYALLLPDLASSHCTAGVRALLAAGVDVNTMGNDGCTALHWACWKGWADIVKLTLEQGASLTIEDTGYHATPAGWLDHGRENSIESGGDFQEVERLLRAAGAKMD